MSLQIENKVMECNSMHVILYTKTENAVRKKKLKYFFKLQFYF